MRTRLFTKFTDTDLQIAYSTTDTEGGADKSYIPKCTNLYLYEETDCSFYFNDGTTTSNIVKYMPFGQDLKYNDQNYSSNFGLDISTLLLTEVNNSLYGSYYGTYLRNLFNDKTRKVAVSTIMPLSMLVNLTLDAAIIIRDKRYRIDSMKTDLTTGKVDLVLITDLTLIDLVSDTGVAPVIPSLPAEPIDSGGTTIYVPVKPKKPVYTNFSFWRWWYLCKSISYFRNSVYNDFSYYTCNVLHSYYVNYNCSCKHNGSRKD